MATSEYAGPDRAPNLTLLERIEQLERWRREEDETDQKTFARLRRVEDRVDSILGSEPKMAELPSKERY